MVELFHTLALGSPIRSVHINNMVIYGEKKSKNKTGLSSTIRWRKKNECNKAKPNTTENLYPGNRFVDFSVRSSSVKIQAASFLVMEKSSLRNNQFYHNGFISSNRREFITNTAKLPLETVKKLIAAVGERPDLWDRYYGKNGQKRCDHNLLWRGISAEVNLPVEICRTKWGHLRDNFRKVYIRNKLSDETPTSWRFYNDMRFMEQTIASNIEFKNRHKSQHQNHSIFQKEKSSETLTPAGQREDEIRLRGYNFHEEPQPNFEDSSLNNDIYSNDDMPAFKRIKLEHPDPVPEKELQGYSYFDNNTLSSTPSTTATNVHSHQQLQDAESLNTDNELLEECYRSPISYHKSKSNSQIYTIEMFDDDQPRELFAPERQNSNKTDEHVKRSKPKLCNPRTNFCIDNAAINRSDDHDTDRLFLLSLLPYLHSIPLQRKLHVRQKLQSVLLEESL